MDFEQVRAKNIQLEIVSEGDNPVVRISGEISKVAFSGIYNVNRKTIADLEVDGKKITQAIPLQQLRAILVKKFGITREALSETEEVQETESTGRATASINDIAVSVLYGELKKLGVELEVEQIEIVDINQAIFKVKTQLNEFIVRKKENKITNLVVNSPIGEIRVNGDVTFAELKKRIDSILLMAEESL